MAVVKEITTDTLAAWLQDKKECALLDIRPLAQRAEEHLPQSVHFDAYDELKAGNDKALDAFEFDPAQPVITLFAGGRLSIFAADILAQKVADAYSLVGGIDAWKTKGAFETPKMNAETPIS